MQCEFLRAATFILTAATAVAAQGQSSSVPLTELQNDLVRLLEKNSSYSEGSIDNRLKDVRFSGCRMSFESESIRRGINADPPPPSGDMRTQGTLPARTDLRRSIYFSFDLAEINPSEVAERFERGKAVTFMLPAIDGAEVIEYRQEMRGLREGPRLIKSAALTVRKKVAGEVKEKLIAAMRACQK